MLTFANVRLRSLLKDISLLDSMEGALLMKWFLPFRSLLRIAFTDLMLTCVEVIGGDLDNLL